MYHQATCPCIVCKGLGHIAMECPQVKRQKWATPINSSRKRDQVTPDRFNNCSAGGG